MANLFSLYNNFKRKKYTVKKGSLNNLKEYKEKLVAEVKKMRQERTKLNKQIKENKKDIEEAEDLSETIEVLENNKHILEKEVANLYKAKELTLNIKDLYAKIKELEKEENQKKEIVSHLDVKKNELEKDISNLKEEKALIIDEIENLKNNKMDLSDNRKFSMEYIDSLSGFEFEKYFAEILDKLGFYDIKVTSGSGDFGIDVLAYNDEILYGFQCKLYSEDVGNKAVQEAYSGKEHYNCNVAVVVTNRFFTEQARQQAKETKVLLWDRTILTNKLNEAKKMDFNINI